MLSDTIHLMCESRILAATFPNMHFVVFGVVPEKRLIAPTPTLSDHWLVTHLLISAFSAI